MTPRIACVAGLIWMLWAIPAQAACSGSGTTWSCPAGSSSSDVSTVLGNASDGATITFASGSYTWSSFVSFSNSKGATLICASQGSCTVSNSGTVLGMNGNLSGTNNHPYRISGFVLRQSGASFTFWFYGAGTLSQLRVDHNTFNTPSGAVAVFLGENATVANFYGVIDHNTMSSSGSSALLNIIGTTNNSPPPSPFGTINNMFVEDNTVSITTMDNAGDGCMDAWGSAAIVWRHNTTTNCLVTTHGVTHAGGPQNVELYENRLIVNSGASGQGVSDGYRLFHHQGSEEFVAFNNLFTASSGKSGTPLDMMHYRSHPNSIDGGAAQCDGTRSIDGNRSTTATNRGYPCWRQPGRDATGKLKPMYVWNNKWSDTAAQIQMSVSDFGGSPDYFSNQMQANREWYNSVSASAQTSASSPFNGTTGMGFGTLANRPTTCTTNANESGGGVGYFATDAGAQGTLYRCSATNTWTVQYTPYTYPHPLVNGGVPPPSDTTAPSVPTSVTATSISSSQITVTWTASTDNVGVTGYKIFRNGTQVGTSASPNYADTGLSPSTTYSYTVSAFDAAGNSSPQSGTASATTGAVTPPSDTTAPSVPTTVTATTISSSQINLTWIASTDNVAVTGYKIFRQGTHVGTSALPNYSNTGLSPSTTYSYTVSAFDAAGNTSAQSTSASATTASATPYSITVTQTPNGIITPGTASFAAGANQTSTITPNANYAIASVTVDSTNQTGNATWADLGTKGANTLIRSIANLGGGIVVGGGQTIIRSIDNGLTWTDLGPLAGGVVVLKVVYVGNNTVIAGTTNGRIFRSTNTGSTWADLGTQFAQTHVYGLANLTGGVVVAGTTPGGLILRSTDYGATWTNLGRQGTETTIYGIEKLGGNIVVAGCGTSADILRSTDNGLTWTSSGRQAGESDIDFIAGLGNSTAIASTYPGGKLLRSTNDGLTWTDLGRFDSVDTMSNVASAGNGIAVAGAGKDGHLWRTTNYGASWTDLGQLGGETLLRPAYIDNQTFVVGTYPNGKIYRATQNGFGTNGSYTFSNVQSNHSITATYTVSGGGGTAPAPPTNLSAVVQ